MTNSEIFKKAAYDSLDKQVGGKHYKNMKIQPLNLLTKISCYLRKATL